MEVIMVPVNTIYFMVMVTAFVEIERVLYLLYRFRMARCDDPCATEELWI